MNKYALAMGIAPACIADFTHKACQICVRQFSDENCPLLLEETEKFKIDFLYGGVICLSFEEVAGGF